MTPKEKAEELFKKYYYEAIAIEIKAKQCALIAVDEIIAELTKEISPSIHGFRHNYWRQVKNEIELL